MIDIVVTRGTGLPNGEPYVSELLTDPGVALIKGTALLDEFAEAHSTLVITLPYRGGITLGQTTRIDDGVNGLVWVGKVVAINHKVNDGTFTTELSIDKVDSL